MKQIVIFLAVCCALFLVVFLVIFFSGGSNISISKDIEGVVWEKIFDGDREGSGNCVQQTSDGGYIVVGEGIWLIKTDADGNELWSKTFGREGYDTGYCVQQTSDGGYIIAGVTGSTYGISSYGFYLAGGGDVWLIKTDADGNELWNKTFGGYRDDDVGYCVQQTADGDYIIAGVTESYGAGEWDVWLIKTDSEGNELWNKTFGGEKPDVGYCVQQTSDGGYVVAGATVSYGDGSSDIWLIKTDADGNEIWNKTFDRTELDTGNYVQQTTDGGYIVEGVIGNYFDGSSDIWLIKTDADGNEIWNKTFGGADSDTGHCVQQTTDGGYIVVGETVCEEHFISDILLTKLSASGDISWQLVFGGSERDEGYSVIQTTDGNYVITGYTAEAISGFASCANLDRTYYSRLFLIKLTHDN